jgi:hypothetical protein
MINLELAIRYFTQYLWWKKVFNLKKQELLQKVLKLYNTQNIINENKKNILKIMNLWV